jgi:hypothetical protein
MAQLAVTGAASFSASSPKLTLLKGFDDARPQSVDLSHGRPSRWRWPTPQQQVERHRIRTDPRICLRPNVRRSDKMPAIAELNEPGGLAVIQQHGARRTRRALVLRDHVRVTRQLSTRGSQRRNSVLAAGC